MAKKYERIKLTWGQAYPSMSTTICMQIVAGRLHEAKRGAGLCELWPRIMGKHSQHDAMHRTFLRPCYLSVAFKGQSGNLAYWSWSTSDSGSLKISVSKPGWKTHRPNVESVPERVVRAYRSCGKNLGWSQLQTANTKYENTRKVQKKYFLGTVFGGRSNSKVLFDMVGIGIDWRIMMWIDLVIWRGSFWVHFGTLVRQKRGKVLKN